MISWLLELCQSRCSPIKMEQNMKYMLISVSILGICMNINFATNEVISLIASKGAVPYEFIRESQMHLSRTSLNDESERKGHGSPPISIVRSPIADSDEDFFKRDMSWVNVDAQQSQSSEELISTVVIPRPRATVTFTRTNVVTEVQFGSILRGAFDHGTPLASVSATPINDVPRPLRPSTRTLEGRLKEAQINNILPVEFGINPRTNEESVVLIQRRLARSTPFKPSLSIDLSSTPALTTSQANHTVPRQFSAIDRSQEPSVFESCVSKVSAQTKVDESQEIEI